MIRHVSLRNWRAYDQLDLTLGRPVTFLVAANGVGKSSLVEAVRWALLGTPADRDRGRAVRAGHDSATVTIQLILPIGSISDLSGRDQNDAQSVDMARGLDRTDEVRAEVTRTLRRNGTSTFSATVNGRNLAEDAYLRLLTRAWNADVHLLDSIIFGLPPSLKPTGFPLRDHLASVFGIEPMVRAGAEVKARRDSIAAQVRTLRDDMSGTVAAITAARAAAEQLDEAVSSAESTLAASEDQSAYLNRRARQAIAWREYRERAAGYRVRAQSLLSEMAAALAEPAGGWGQDPVAALTAARDEATSAIERARSAASDAAVAAARSTSAVDLLSAADGMCPTCLRPITAAERNSALAVHTQHGDEGLRAAAGFEQQTAAARAHLTAVAQFAGALAELRVPVEPEHDDPGPEAVTDAAQAVALAQEHAQALGSLRERRDAAARQLALLETAAADGVQLYKLAAQDLALELAQRSLADIADRLLAERVEPLATEISHRWKLLFGSEGLQLGADGQLRLGRSDMDLSLADLSGGERATALLITRVILAASATAASTLWLDEPLEHLDPARRANVAQTLVRAAQTGTIAQIVVTTYEEGLARRLQATAPDLVQLVYARATTEQDAP